MKDRKFSVGALHIREEWSCPLCTPAYKTDMSITGITRLSTAHNSVLLCVPQLACERQAVERAITRKLFTCCRFMNSWLLNYRMGDVWCSHTLVTITLVCLRIYWPWLMDRLYVAQTSYARLQDHTTLKVTMQECKTIQDYMM